MPEKLFVIRKMNLRFDSSWTPEFRDATNFTISCHDASYRVHKEILMHRCKTAILCLNDSVHLPDRFEAKSLGTALSIIYTVGDVSEGIASTMYAWSWDVVRLLDFMGADIILSQLDVAISKEMAEDPIDMFNAGFMRFATGIHEFVHLLPDSWMAFVHLLRFWMQRGHAHRLALHILPRMPPAVLTALVASLSTSVLFPPSFAPSLEYEHMVTHAMPIKCGSWPLRVFDTDLTLSCILATDSLTVNIFGPHHLHQLDSSRDASDLIETLGRRIITIEGDACGVTFRDALAMEVEGSAIVHMTRRDVPRLHAGIEENPFLTLHFGKI